MNQATFKQAYSAFRLAGRLSSLWCRADNAHRARPVFAGAKVTIRRVRDLEATIDRPLWLTLCSVKAGAARSNDGARFYIWRTAASDNMKSRRATLDRFARPDYAPRLLRYASAGDMGHYHQFAGPGAGWRIKEAARNMRELRAAGLT